METLSRKEKGSDDLFGGQQAHSAFSQEKPQTAEPFPWHLPPCPLPSPTPWFSGICLQPFPRAGMVLAGLGKALSNLEHHDQSLKTKPVNCFCPTPLPHAPVLWFEIIFCALNRQMWTSVALVASNSLIFRSWGSQDCLGGKSALRSSILTIYPPLNPVPEHLLEHTQAQICQALTVTSECCRHQTGGFKKLFLLWALFPIDP